MAATVSVQTLQAVQPLRCVQALTSVLPRVPRGRIRRGFQIPAPQPSFSRRSRLAVRKRSDLVAGPTPRNSLLQSSPTTSTPIALRNHKNKRRYYRTDNTDTVASIAILETFA